MINFATLSSPPLPEDVWLAVLGRLDYFGLRKAAGLSRAFRHLVDSRPALARKAFRLHEAEDDVVTALLEGGPSSHAAAEDDGVEARRTVAVHPILERVA